MKYVLLLLPFFLSPVVSADYVDQSEGFYVGGTLGLTQYDDDNFFDDGATVESSFDNDSFGLGIIGGYNVNRWLGFEAGLTTLGNYYEEGDGVNDDDYIDTLASALTISALAHIPMGDVVSLYFQGGFGLAFIAQQIDYDIPGIDIEESESDTAPVGQLGIGLKVNLPAKSHTQLRVGYQHFVFDADLAKVNSSDLFVKEEVDQSIGYFFVGAAFVF